MLDGFYKTEFMNALKRWDSLNKKAICLYRQTMHEFDTNAEWRSDFKVDGGMILDGEWYTEK